MYCSRILVSMAIAFVLLAGSLGMPNRRRFIDVDCDKNITCGKNLKPICGTDNITYLNACYMQKEQQKRYCEIGNFNPLTKAHDGKC